MAEQLQARPGSPAIARFFPLLRALDDIVDAETPPHGLAAPNSAAAVAVIGYKTLFRKRPPLQDHGWPAHVERADEANSAIAAASLRRRGFDPILIDARDPAAYVWAIFEMEEREATHAEREWIHHQRPALPCCLAIVRQPSARRQPQKVYRPLTLQRAAVAG
jgi:hypothetical protein